MYLNTQGKSYFTVWRRRVAKHSLCVYLLAMFPLRRESSQELQFKMKYHVIFLKEELTHYFIFSNRIDSTLIRSVSATCDTDTSLKY